MTDSEREEVKLCQLEEVDTTVLCRKIQCGDSQEAKRRRAPMAELRWTEASLFLMLMLQFAAAVTTQVVLSGDEATLSCENVMQDQEACGGTTWTFNGDQTKAAVELITLGKIGRNARAKSDRLSVTASCSLEIKKVAAEDVGRYFCQQYDESGQRQGQDSQVYLSLINMTEEKDSDDVTFTCSVSTSGRCQHTVKWLFNGNEVEGDQRRAKTPPCSASVHTSTSTYIYQTRSRFLKCEVTAGDRAQLFPFRLQPSGEDGPPTPEPPGTTDAALKHLQGLWWLFVVLAVVLVSVLIIVVKVTRWRRRRGSKPRMNDKIGLTSNPEATPAAAETSPDPAGPEEGVSYATIKFTKKTDSEAQPQTKTDDGDAVTYTTVKASRDHSCVYETIR